jgi:hypothetical protein
LNKNNFIFPSIDHCTSSQLNSMFELLPVLQKNDLEFKKSEASS